MKEKGVPLKEKILDFKYEFLFFFLALYKLFWPYKSISHTNVKVNFLAVLALILFFLFLTRQVTVRKELSEDAKKAFRLILSFFWVSFLSNAALYLENWPKDYEGAKHALAVMCFLLIFFVFDKGKLRWFVPFLMFAMVALKPGIAPALLPSIFLLFYFHSYDGKFSDEIKDLLASAIILTVISLAIFLPKAFRKVIAFSYEQILLNIKTSLFSCFVILPIIILLALILFKASFRASNKKTRAFFKVIFFFSFVTLPVLPFSSNNVSLSTLSIFAVTAFTSYLISVGEKNIIGSLEDIWKKAEKKEYVFLIFLSVVFMAYFSAFTKYSLGTMFFSKSLFELWP